MSTLSGILPWRLPWAEEPGRLQSTGERSHTGRRDSHLLASRSFPVGWGLSGELSGGGLQAVSKGTQRNVGDLLFSAVPSLSRTSTAACQVSALDACSASCFLAGTEL